MKTILVLTDFTENATHAAKTAVILGSKLHTNLLLFNTYLTAPVVPEYAGGPWVVDEIMQRESLCKNKLQRLQFALEDVIERLEADTLKPAVHIQSGEGSLGINVEETIQQKDIELVVMGARSDSTIEHLLNGSETSEVINRSARPVFILPHNVSLKRIKKVVFATDFDQADISAVRYLTKIGKKFNFQLEIVHVAVYGDNNSLKVKKEKEFLSQVSKLDYPAITYNAVRGKDVVNRLNNLCNETGTDMLALVHHQHSFFMRLLKQSTTNDALLNQSIPLLVIPSQIEE